MGPVEAISTCLRKYATFSGRASRSEFWWFYADYILTGLLLGSLGYWMLNSAVLPVFGVLVFYYLPVLSATITRLRDAGRNVGAAFVSFVPTIVTLGGGYLIHQQFVSVGMPYADHLSEVVERQNSTINSWLISIAVAWITSRAILSYLCSKPTNSTRTPNQYGPNPHEVPQ